MLLKWSPEVNVPRTTSCMLIKGLAPARNSPQQKATTLTVATIKLIGLRTFATDAAPRLIAMQAQKF